VTVAGRMRALLLLLAALSCVGEPEGASSPSEPAEWTVASEPMVTIGQVEGDDPYLFTSIRTAAFLPDHGIAVVDGRPGGIRLFSPDGGFLRELGREGEGPGEFARPRQIALVPPDTLEIYDSNLYRLTRYLTSGPLLSTLPLQAEDGMPELYLGRFSTGELAFAWIIQGDRDWSQLTADPMQLGRFDAGGRMVASMGTAEGILRSASGVYALSPYLYAELIGDSLFLTDGAKPGIQVRDRQGMVVDTLTVPVPVLDLPEAWADLEAEIAARGSDTEQGWLEGQPAGGAGVPVLSRFLVDHQDRLWVKAYDPATDNLLLMSGRLRGGTWWVLTTAGEVLATMEIPDDFTLLDVQADRALGKTVDALGVERLEVRRIEGAG